jgi:ATP-binding cassette subfamily B protein
MKKDKIQNDDKMSFSQYIRVSWKTLAIGRRNLSSFWPRLISMTVEVSALVAAAYYSGQILGELVRSIQIKEFTAALTTNLIMGFMMLMITNFASAISSLIAREQYIFWDKWFTLNLNLTRANIDIDFFEDRDNQKLLNKINMKGGWAIANLSEQIYFAYYNILKISLIAGTITKAGWWAPLLIGLSSVPGILTELKRSKLSWGIWDTKGDEFHRHWKTINLFRETKDLIEIKLYGLRDRLLKDEAMKNIEKFNKEQVKASRSTMGADLASSLIYESTFLGITWYFAKSAISGSISVANFGFYTGIINQFSTALKNLSSIISRSSEFIIYAEDFYKILDTKPKIVTKPGAVKLKKGHIPEIEFKGVGFAYRSNKDNFILRNLSFKIKPGEHLALVGENGAGKTTIIKLILRLYDVSEGEILIDGTNIKEIDVDSYWRLVAVLFQDFSRYPFDIKTNIELGRIRAIPPKSKVNRAVMLSNLNPILDKLPKGIDTILDNSFEDGVEPSGGQWQRVALARAFYRDASILILDEPTAAVDANAEYEIFNNIFKSYSDKTALIISHRFSTVRRADRIIVLHKGKIIEEGNHKKLMKNRGLYSEMFSKQAEGYKT